jgi:predicted O-methyltransferase YrrM
MYNSFQLATKYASYYLHALNGKGHGIHSPFVFDFVRNVLNEKTVFPEYGSVEALRAKLLRNYSTITLDDYGAGSMTGTSSQRTVSSITKRTAKSPKLGQLLFRMARYFRPKQILELGTSMGISTAYLASGSPFSSVVTAEGSDAVAAFAAENFASLDLKNISIVKGNFDNTLSEIIASTPQIDMAFVDGNHRLEPTLRYFNQLLPNLTDSSVIIFDDIHWSSEMERAWSAIKDNDRVTATIDLFFFGLVFFNPSFKVKQHFTIRI